MLEWFDDGGVSNLMAKGVFIMGLGKFLVHKIEWKKSIRSMEKR